MRYLIAIFFAVLFAGLATIWLASPLASWVVSMNTFDNPDSVSDLHGLIFMVTNLAALALGWVAGWAVGGSMLSRAPAAPDEGSDAGPADTGSADRPR